jgi:hypothetical protein
MACCVPHFVHIAGQAATLCGRHGESLGRQQRASLLRHANRLSTAVLLSLSEGHGSGGTRQPSRKMLKSSLAEVNTVFKVFTAIQNAPMNEDEADLVDVELALLLMPLDPTRASKIVKQMLKRTPDGSWGLAMHALELCAERRCAGSPFFLACSVLLLCQGSLRHTWLHTCLEDELKQSMARAHQRI